jgi:hypothetical protein
MDLKQVNTIYEEILGMGIELEPDPTVLGPRYLNQVISQCRNYLNRATMLLLQIQREKRGFSQDLAGQEAAYQIELNQLLSENETIRRLPNIKDREASANMALRDRISRVVTLKQEISDLDTIEKAVLLRHKELVRTSDNIKTQRSLLLADRVSGAGYGDEFDGPRDGKGRALPMEDNGIDEGEIDRLMRAEAGNFGTGCSDSSEAPVVEAEASELKLPVPEPKVSEPKLPVVEAKPEPVPDPKPEVVASPPKVEPPPMKEEPVVMAPSGKEESALDLADMLLSGSPIPAATPSTEEADINRFLGSEISDKANGSTSKSEVKAKKKEEKPKPQLNEAKSSPAGEDGDFDFSDLLKNI